MMEEKEQEVPQVKKRGTAKPAKADTVPLADHQQLVAMFDELMERNKQLIQTVTTLETQQGFLMKGHKPFTDTETEQARAKILENSRVNFEGIYSYEILPTFGDDRIPFKNSFCFKSNQAPSFVEETTTGEVDEATARRVLTEYNIASGSEFQPEDMVVTCSEDLARGR